MDKELTPIYTDFGTKFVNLELHKSFDKLALQRLIPSIGKFCHIGAAFSTLPI